MFTLDIDQELRLALIQPSFAKTYYDIVAQQRSYLSQWLAWPEHADGEGFFLSFIQTSLQNYAAGKSLTCSVIFSGQIVGTVSFNSIDHNLKKVEIGYWLREDYQGRGIMTRVVRKLIEVAFEEYQMEKVEIAAAEGNKASRSLCERLGFTLEGIITRAENLNGRIVDHAIYGLAKSHVTDSK